MGFYHTPKRKIVNFLSLKKIKNKLMVIKCSPKDSNGVRIVVRSACNESCVFWEKCCEEVNVGSVPNRFVEEEPNKYEIEDGIFHMDYKGLKKVWILKKK